MRLFWHITYQYTILYHVRLRDVTLFGYDSVGPENKLVGWYSYICVYKDNFFYIFGSQVFLDDMCIMIGMAVECCYIIDKRTPFFFVPKSKQLVTPDYPLLVIQAWVTIKKWFKWFFFLFKISVMYDLLRRFKSPPFKKILTRLASHKSFLICKNDFI